MYYPFHVHVQNVDMTNQIMEWFSVYALPYEINRGHNVRVTLTCMDNTACAHDVMIMASSD